MLSIINVQLQWINKNGQFKSIKNVTNVKMSVHQTSWLHKKWNKTKLVHKLLLNNYTSKQLYF